MEWGGAREGGRKNPGTKESLEGPKRRREKTEKTEPEIIFCSW
jgi:hypothetical protein